MKIFIKKVLKKLSTFIIKPGIRYLLFPVFSLLPMEEPVPKPDCPGTSVDCPEFLDLDLFFLALMPFDLFPRLL